MARKNKKEDTSKEVAKKAGIFYGVKKLVGGLTKLAMVGAVGAAVMKVMRKDTSPAT